VSQLDQLSAAIGALTAQQQEAVLQREKTWAELHQINLKLTAYHADLSQLKNRGWGVLAGLAVASGGLGAAGTWILKLLSVDR
jgi:hypothetical protein